MKQGGEQTVESYEIGPEQRNYHPGNFFLHNIKRIEENEQLFVEITQRKEKSLSEI